MKKLFLIPLLVVLVAGLAFGGCAKSAPTPAPSPAPAPAPAPEQPPIKIGLLYPLTGPVALAGEMMVQALKWEFEEVGSEVGGRKIETIVDDSGGESRTAIDKARKQLEYDKVDILLGPLISGYKCAVGDIASSVGKPHLVTGPAPPCFVERKWSFAPNGSMNQEPSAMADYAYNKMGIRTVTIMTTDYAAGHDFLDPFMNTFKKIGGKVIQEQYPPEFCADFAPYLTALKDADAVVAWFAGADAIQFLNQYHDFGIRKRMPVVAAFYGSFYSPYILNEVRPEAADAVIGEITATSWTQLLDNEANKRFIEDYKAARGIMPDEPEGTALVGALTVLEALKATGGDTTPEKLRQTLLSVEFMTHRGIMRFDQETRCSINNVYIVKIDKRDGKYVCVPIHTYEEVPPSGL